MTDCGERHIITDAECELDEGHDPPDLHTGRVEFFVVTWGDYDREPAKPKMAHWEDE